jgi:hypothetical protein
VSGLEIGSQAKTKRELELEANNIDILSQLNQSRGVNSGLIQESKRKCEEIKKITNQVNEQNQALKMLECDINQKEIELNLFRGQPEALCSLSLTRCTALENDLKTALEHVTKRKSSLQSQADKDIQNT